MAERLLWIDTRGEPVITTTPNGKRNAIRWGWTPAVAVAVTEQGGNREEPDGEVEYRVFDRDGEFWASTNSLDEARHYLAQDPGGFARIERAVWVPVEQEDE